MGHSFVKSCSWSAFYICVGGEGRERENSPCSVTFIEEPFLGPGCLLNLTSPFSQKQKTKKKLDFSKTD